MDELITKEELQSDGRFLIIKINKLYKKDMTAVQLYEATRGYWRIDVKHADEAEYVLSVAHGTVVEVYEPLAWAQAGTTAMETRGPSKDPEHRYEFTGSLAPEELRNKYIGRSVKGLFKFGAVSPVTYFF
ncbi:MAG: hypothetical protein VZT48_06530 [Bulleidia sp.]|nr:hypothetical protein [Bulleidia sp.]